VGDVLAGVVVSAFVALVMREIVRVNFIRFLNPLSWFWGDASPSQHLRSAARRDSGWEADADYLSCRWI
ncbi:MAG: hypothetical protein P8X50_15420, partial [Maritimibacter sp.]